MPRIQVYLPDDLYKQLKKKKLKASELFQKALREELRRMETRAEMQRYLDDLDAELGPPSAEAVAWAEEIVSGKRRPAKKKRSA